MLLRVEAMADTENLRAMSRAEMWSSRVYGHRSDEGTNNASHRAGNLRTKKRTPSLSDIKKLRRKER